MHSIRWFADDAKASAAQDHHLSRRHAWLFSRALEPRRLLRRFPRDEVAVRAPLQRALHGRVLVYPKVGVHVRLRAGRVEHRILGMLFLQGYIRNE